RLSRQRCDWPIPVSSSYRGGDCVAAEASADEGEIMQERLRWQRRVQLAGGVALCVALWGSSAQAFPEEDLQRVWLAGGLRLWSSEIPDRGRIIACMMHKRGQLSAECRSVFGKPAQSASAERRGGW